MRRLPLLLLLALPGCSTYELLTDSCNVEYIELSWPVTIERGASSSNAVLFNRLSRSNVSIDQFDMLKRAFIAGENQTASAAVWSVSAFNVNGGYISLVHRVPLPAGETVPIVTAFEGGGWGTLTGRPSSSASAAVRAGTFTATTAKGTLLVLAASPLSLRVDLTATNQAGEDIRVRGDAAFSLRRETGSCT